METNGRFPQKGFEICSEQKENLLMVITDLQTHGESWNHCWRMSLFCCSSVVVCHWTLELLFRREGWSERTAKTLETPCQSLKSELGCCKGIFPFRGLEETRAIRVWRKERSSINSVSCSSLWSTDSVNASVLCFNVVGTSPASLFCLLTINWLRVTSVLRGTATWRGTAYCLGQRPSTVMGFNCVLLSAARAAVKKLCSREGA